MSDQMLKVLVIAEHNNEHLHAQTFKLLGAAHELVKSSKSFQIDILIAGYQCSALAQQLTSGANIFKIMIIDAPSCVHQLAENMAPAIADIASVYSHILVASSTQGKNLIPRVGGLLDLQPISDVVAFVDEHTFKRPIYAGSAIATVVSDDAIKLLTIRTSAFDAPPTSQESMATVIEQLAAPQDAELSSFVEEQVTKSERPELTAAKVVISGGRGLQNGENFSMLYQLADTLGGAVGASRAAVDAGFVANDLQVGQTGKIVAPELYIAIGISGAVQHLAGMKDSKVIVAINNDPDAPIFQVADYGLVGDLFEVVPQLIKSLG
jgi:electron transfer flavoprotein alpha subunit